jgi:hypothetical protein
MARLCASGWFAAAFATASPCGVLLMEENQVPSPYSPGTLRQSLGGGTVLCLAQWFSSHHPAIRALRLYVRGSPPSCLRLDLPKETFAMTSRACATGRPRLRHPRHARAGEHLPHAIPRLLPPRELERGEGAEDGQGRHARGCRAVGFRSRARESTVGERWHFAKPRRLTTAATATSRCGERKGWSGAPGYRINRI